MSKKYIIDYFIKKFEAIPRSKWTIREFENDGKYCALGHCGAEYISGRGESLPAEAIALQNIIWHYSSFYGVCDINDGEESTLKQKTPKGRILAALRQIKRKNQL